MPLLVGYKLINNVNAKLSQSQSTLLATFLPFQIDMQRKHERLNKETMSKF